MNVEKLEKQFSELAQKIYESGERRIKPSYPWVLIRVVPKEQMVGGVYLSENSGMATQHKPVHEGIVLKTWEPFIQEYSSFEIADIPYYKHMKSEFVPGDRILYPHFAGLPVNFLDERNYRLVREITSDVNGGVFCRVNYDGDIKYRAVLETMFQDLQSVTLSGL